MGLIYFAIRTHFSPAAGCVAFVSSSYKKVKAFADAYEWHVSSGYIYIVEVNEDEPLSVASWENLSHVKDRISCPE